MFLLKSFLREFLFYVEIDRLVVSKISENELEHLIFLSWLKFDRTEFPPVHQEITKLFELLVDVLETHLLFLH